MSGPLRRIIGKRVERRRKRVDTQSGTQVHTVRFCRVFFECRHETLVRWGDRPKGKRMSCAECADVQS